MFFHGGINCQILGTVNKFSMEGFIREQNTPFRMFQNFYRYKYNKVAGLNNFNLIPFQYLKKYFLLNRT